MTQSSNLKWEVSGNNFTFRLIDAQGDLIAPKEWGLHSVIVGQGAQGSVAPLIGLIEDGVIDVLSRLSCCDRRNAVLATLTIAIHLS